MNPIEEQQELITKLYHLIDQSAEEDYESATCEFEYFVAEDDGSSSIDSCFSYTVNDENISAFLNDTNPSMLNKLIPDLHAKMKAHTGGSWESFTLTIHKDRTLTVKFHYPEENTDA